MRAILLFALVACTGGTTDPDTSTPVDDTDTGPEDTGDPPDTDTDTDTDTGVPPVDADEDGYTEDVDCDDADPSVHPGAEEVCDEVDQDCDDEVDEDLLVTHWPDTDGDGYGYGAARESCEVPSGHVLVTGDCDDGDGDVHPGATERCDGVDGNCDGVDDACWLGSTTLASADAKLTGETAGDRVGLAMIGGEDWDGDGVTDIVVGADVEGTAGVNAGALYVVPGTTRGTFGLAGAPVKIVGEGIGGQAGHILAGAGDIDGDGNQDLLTGAFHVANGSTTRAGAAYLLLGPVSSGSVADADVIVRGVYESDKAGHAVAGLDADGDGVQEMIVGSEGWDGGYADGGGVFVFSSPSGELTLEDADVVFTGEGSDDAIGHNTVPAGDVDGDGYEDLLICAPEVDTSKRDVGALYLLLGPLDASASVEDADAIWEGEADGDEAAHHAVPLGDLDDDGTIDLAVDAWFQDGGGTNAGAAYIVYGPHAGRADIGLAAATRIDGASSGDEAAVHLAAPGDVDGDGVPDLWLGAYLNDRGGTDAGAGYLIYGPPAAGVWDLSSADATFLGERGGDQAGFGTGAAGDLDGDGLGDALIGAMASESGAGAVYLILGLGP